MAVPVTIFNVLLVLTGLTEPLHLNDFEKHVMFTLFELNTVV